MTESLCACDLDTVQPRGAGLEGTATWWRRNTPIHQWAARAPALHTLPAAAQSLQRVRRAGLGALPKPPGDLGPTGSAMPRWRRDPQERGRSGSSPHPQQQLGHSVRLAGGLRPTCIPGSSASSAGRDQPESPHPETPRPRPRWASASPRGPPAAVSAGLGGCVLGDRLGNASVSWPALGIRAGRGPPGGGGPHC